MNEVQQKIAGLLFNPSPMLGRWISHSCPSCHNGSSNRIRGSYLFEGDNFAFNCFNCSYKAGWRPGNGISENLTLLLDTVGASTNDKLQLKLMAEEVKRTGNFPEQEKNTQIYQKITPRILPESAKTFNEWATMESPPHAFITVLEKVYERNKYLLDLEMYWCPEYENDLQHRFLMPYYVNSQLIGYAGRDTRQYTSLKYFNQVSTNTFFNYDLIHDKYCNTLIVAEGVLDAALINGLGANNNVLSELQINQLKDARNRGKRVIFLPDRDKSGKVMIQQAIEHEFEVSMPDWGIVNTPKGNRYIKDFEEAVQKYGRLFSTLMVSKNVYSTEFEIKVQMSRWI